VAATITGITTAPVRGIAGITLPEPAGIAGWLLRGLRYALQNQNRTDAPRFLLLLPELVVESVRRRGLRPAEIRIQVPDEIARDLSDQQDGGDRGAVYALVAIPRDALQRAGSALVLPGEQR
jgi:hypothetical protein